MSDTVIKVEGLGKRYKLKRQTEGPGYHKLSDTLIHAAKAPLRWLRPSTLNSELSTQREDFWALKDINFEIKRGEVLGVIGRNGAGKSTLLKILSRITEPTVGRVTLRGRVASLLEVGTGFHPELTGRENIFLSGVILGMNKAEVRARFDEIVTFAESAAFIDMPVKHYSTGMQMRLAFSVAAHLEPDVLVVDEVLAVGDAGFQKKCLGKIESVTSSSGRTVVFVSHNLDAISRLSRRCIVLHQGRTAYHGATDAAIAWHQNTTTSSGSLAMARSPACTAKATLQRFWFCDEDGTEQTTFQPGQTIIACFDVITHETAGLNAEAAFAIETNRERPIFSTHASDSGTALRLSGHQVLRTRIEPNILRRGSYLISAGIYSRDFLEKHDEVLHMAAFSVVGGDSSQPDDRRWGDVYLPLQWQSTQLPSVDGPAR